MVFEFADLNDVISSIEEIWSRLGVDEKVKTSEKITLEQSIMDLFNNCLNKYSDMCTKTDQQIQSIKNEHISLLQAIKADQSEIDQVYTMSTDLPLLEQVKVVTESYNTLENKYREIINRLKILHQDYEVLTETLGIQKETAYLSDAISDDFLAIMEKKVKELNDESNSRKDVLLKLNHDLSTLSSELEIEIPNEIVAVFAENSLLIESISKVQRYVKTLSDLKASRVKDISAIVNKIKQLWEILETDEEEQQAFFNAHSTLGLSVVESCVHVLESLQMKRNEQLPKLISTLRERIYQTCLEMHQEFNEIDENDYDKQDELFEEYQKEYERIEQIKYHMHPFLEVINQREEMINEMNRLEKLKKPSPKDDQAKRRMKSLLPRHEKKLVLMLTEYKEEFGYDLMWDGEAYINKLSHIRLSDLEIKTSKAKGRKQSLQNQKPVAQNGRRFTGSTFNDDLIRRK